MKVSTLVAAMLVAFVCSYIVYFGFTTNYTKLVFSKDSFTNQYGHDVFKYRILSQYLLIRTDELLGNSIPTNGAERRLLIMDPRASQRFYYAYFVLNTLFLVLTSMVLVFLLEENEWFTWERGERRLLFFLLPVLISLTQFVITPYDVSGYFFQLLTIYLFLLYIDRHYWLGLVLTGGLIVLATLNRESSAMTVAFLVIISLYKWGLSRKAWISLSIFGGCFLATYLALHVLIQDPGWTDPHYVNKWQLNLVWSLSHWGLVFWGLFTWLVIQLCHGRENRLLILYYYLACLPYILTCIVSGIWWELRLFIPLFLGALLLSQLNLPFLKEKPLHGRAAKEQLEDK